MNNQALFSSKYKSKKLKCHLLEFLFGTLRVNPIKCQGGIAFNERERGEGGNSWSLKFSKSTTAKIPVISIIKVMSNSINFASLFSGG